MLLKDIFRRGSRSVESEAGFVVGRRHEREKKMLKNWLRVLCFRSGGAWRRTLILGTLG